MKTVLVCADDSRGIQRIVEFASPHRAAELAKASNAIVVRRRTGEIVRVKLQSYGDDSNLRSMGGDGKHYSHDHETDTNPGGVWTLYRLPASSADIYGAVVTDCLAKKAA